MLIILGQLLLLPSFILFLLLLSWSQMIFQERVQLDLCLLSQIGRGECGGRQNVCTQEQIHQLEQESRLSSLHLGRELSYKLTFEKAEKKLWIHKEGKYFGKFWSSSSF